MEVAPGDTRLESGNAPRDPLRDFGSCRMITKRGNTKVMASMHFASGTLCGTSLANLDWPGKNIWQPTRDSPSYRAVYASLWSYALGDQVLDAGVRGFGVRRARRSTTCPILASMTTDVDRCRCLRAPWATRQIAYRRGRGNTPGSKSESARSRSRRKFGVTTPARQTSPIGAPPGVRTRDA